METQDSLERARQAIIRCRMAAVRAKAALQRAQDGFVLSRAETEARLLRAEAAMAATGIGLQQNGALHAADLLTEAG